MSNNNITNTSSIVSKVWAFCNTLRDDGVGYGVCVKHYTIFQFIRTCLHVTDKIKESITPSRQQAEALRQSILKNVFERRLI